MTSHTSLDSTGSVATELEPQPQVVVPRGVGHQTGQPVHPHVELRDQELRALTPAEFAAWDAFVDRSPQGSPFVRSWWLRAVGGTTQILGYFKKGQLVAGIPLYSEKRFGITLYTMPKLTQTLGPVLAPQTGEHVRAVWDEMEILGAFAEALGKRSIFFQGFHPSLQNWSPFYWNGFSQTSRATHILDLQDLDQVWSGIAHRTRRAVRSSEREGIRVVACSPDDVWHAEEKTFAIQNMKVPHSIEYLRQLHNAAKENNAGECFAAIDKDQRMHCAAFMIWDHRRTYAIALGGDPQLRGRGSTAFLMWHMIQFAAQNSPIFDFSGSMLQPVELFLRSLGTTQVPYNWIMKFPFWLKVYLVSRHKL